MTPRRTTAIIISERVGRADRTWADDAGCRSVDTAVFFSYDAETISWAKRICSVCEVRAECRAFADAAGAVDGVWGGEDRSNRQVLNARKRASRARVAARRAG